MIYLLHGDSKVAIRDRLRILMELYPSTAITTVESKRADSVWINNYLQSFSMFESKRLLIIEGKANLAEVVLDGVSEKSSDVSMVLVVEGTVASKDSLFKIVQSQGGEIEKFEEEPDKDIFTFIDAVARKQRSVAMRELKKLFLDGKEPIYVHTMLVWQFRHIFAPELAKGYVQKKAQELRKLYSDDELCKIYAALYQLEILLKTGEGVPEILIEEFVVRITK